MNQTSTSDALNAFRKVDFNWATQLQDIWTDPAYDVPDLHGELRKEFVDKIHSMSQQNARSPLGWFLVGSGGVGKTHLLGAVRREAARQSAGFVLVDMTDVRDFWDVVLQGYLDSLQTVYIDDQFQYQVLLHNFIKRVSPEDQAARNLERLARRKTSALSKDVTQIVMALRRKYPREALEYQDVVRALICLNSQDIDIAMTGMSWLQSQEIDEESTVELGFSRKQRRSLDIVRALSWFMSLSGPTIVAFDQLDPIVQQVKYQAQGHNHLPSEEEGTARAIIEQIGGGLGAMVDMTFNTLSVVSCVESTLNLLNELVLSTYLDRYESPRRLQRPPSADAYRLMIRERLAPAYQESSFEPAYDTWPFSTNAIDQLQHESAREVLKLCEQHRKHCIRFQQVSELTSFDSNGQADIPEPNPEQLTDRWKQLDAQFETYRQQANPEELLDEKSDDDRLAPLYRTALQCLIHEHEPHCPEHIESIVEHEFSGGKTTKPLHARLRIVDHLQDSREDHYCVRALQRRHHSAYGTRLKAAMTQSGIDKSLKFRHLIIVRSFESPGGPKTESLTQSFQKAGGRFHCPTEGELRTLAALHRMQKDHHPEFADWLSLRQPVTKLELGKVLTFGNRFISDASNNSPEQAASERTDAPEKEPTEALDPTEGLDQIAKEKSTETKPLPAPTPDPASDITEPEPDDPPPTEKRGEFPTDLPFGRKLVALGELGETLTLPISLLTKHTMILGGSGSGKSVTLRRIVEEAALAGIPSIVIDCAQDMCLFDQPWTAPHELWEEGDAEKARQFHTQTEQIIWTPGSLTSGNPLSLRPLPDFKPLQSDAEELEDAVLMACDGLKEIVASGNSQKAKKSHGILVNSLRYFAKHFPDKGLNGFIEFLSELPDEAELGLENEQKLAKEIAGSLKVEQTTNPLLIEGGSPLDPLVLFGDDQDRDKTRISVISLVKLKGQNAAHSFLNQLAMELFSWIKQNPTPPDDRPLRGLLVIDEARDFVPSQKSTECKESIMRLAAQARKYRLGLVFATQHPKDIQTKIVGNCATHLYGLNNSPASIQTLQDLMAQKGGSGDDIPKLKAGQFYIYNADAGHKSPVKIKIPFSLSYSPKNPLEEADIMEKATNSANSLQT